MGLHLPMPILYQSQMSVLVLLSEKVAKRLGSYKCGQGAKFKLLKKRFQGQVWEMYSLRDNLKSLMEQESLLKR
jgi:hypothetical protein